jgi:hypothetical protein
MEVLKYEERVKQIRNERTSEARRIERLISALVKQKAFRNGFAERIA